LQLLPDLINPAFLAAALLVTLVGGFVKGAVGFAMPMIMISGLSSFLSPELALAALIVPTVISNVWQALRGGLGAALNTLRNYRVFITLLLIFIALSAQLAGRLSQSGFFLLIGLPVTGFALLQLMGWRFAIAPQHRRRAQAITGSIAGVIGGLSGVWGPLTVAYLTAVDTPKQEQVRVQGVIYGLGAIMLMLAHFKSGVLNAGSLALSLWMVPPALLGMALGFWVQDRLNQQVFRRATLLVLVVAGLNLIRRALTG